MRDMKLGIIITAKAKIFNATNKAISALDKLEKKSYAVSKRFMKIGAVSIASATSVGLGAKKMVDSYQEIAKAQGEIASLDINADGIEKITKAAKRFSGQYAGITAPEFIKASYDIKSGIASLSDAGVADMTRMAALTARATKASAADMSKLFAMGYGIYRKEFKSDFDFGQKFSAGIAAAVKSFRTDGADLINGLSTLGAVAEKSGYKFEQQLSALGVAKSSYSTASEAATGLRAFLVGAGVAQKKLNLKFTDSKGHLKDIATILELLKHKYKDLSKKSVQDKLKKAFGSDEATKFIMALIDKTGELKKSTKELHDTMEQGESYTKKMAQATNRGNEFEILEHKIFNLSSTIGKVFAPTALKIANYIGKVTDKIEKWSKENPKAAKNFADWGIKGAIAVASIGAVSMGIAAISFSVGTLSKVIKAGLYPFRLLSKSAKKSCADVKCLDRSSTKSAKSIRRLASSVDSARSVFAKGLMLSVGIAGVSAVLYGLNQISKASHNAIMDKRIIFGSNKDGSYSKADLQKLLEKEKRLKKRIKDSKNGSWWESFVNGQNDKAKIEHLNKLLKKTQDNINKAKSGWKPRVVKETKVSKAQIAKSVAFSKKVHQIWDLKISNDKKRELLKLLTSGKDINLNTIKKYNTVTKKTNVVNTQDNINKAKSGWKPRVVKETKVSKAQIAKSVAFSKVQDAPKKPDSNTLEFLKIAKTSQDEAKALKAQYDALSSTVRTIASKPPNQNFNITIHAQSSNPADIEIAVRRAISSMNTLASQRSLNDN